jgi:hypothetical protein
MPKRNRIVPYWLLTRFKKIWEIRTSLSEVLTQYSKVITTTASALRVLSSIRVKLIVQIIIMSIQKGIKDTSPYVRKTAAHAISKVYKYRKKLILILQSGS